MAWTLLLVGFLSFQFGRVWAACDFIIREARRFHDEGDEVEDETTEWEHDECGAAVAHDDATCPDCGEEIDTWTDHDGVLHEGLPMWQLGES